MGGEVNFRPVEDLEVLLGGALPSFTAHRTGDERLRHLTACVRTARSRLESPEMAPAALRQLARYVWLATSSVLPLDHPVMEHDVLTGAIRELRRAELVDDRAVEKALDAIRRIETDPRNALMELLVLALREQEATTLEPLLVVPPRLAVASSHVTTMLNAEIGRSIGITSRPRLSAVEVGTVVFLCGNVTTQYRNHAHLLCVPARFHLLGHSWQNQDIPRQPGLERSPRRVRLSITTGTRRAPSAHVVGAAAPATHEPWIPMLEDHVFEYAESPQIASADLPLPGEESVPVVCVRLGNRQVAHFDLEGYRRVVIPRWLTRSRQNVVKLLPVTELGRGMLWAQGGSTEEVVGLLQSDPNYRKLRDTTQGWKNRLRHRLDTDFDGLMKELVRAGCDLDVMRSNIRSWASDARSLPRSRQTFTALLRALGLERTIEILWRHGRELQIAHQTTGFHQHRHLLENMTVEDERELRLHGRVVLGSDPHVRDTGLVVYEIDDLQDVDYRLPERSLDRICTDPGADR